MAASPAREPTGGDEDPAASSPEPSGGPAGYELVAWEPVVTRPDPMTEEEQQALLDAVTDQDAPWWLEEGDPDPEDDPPPEEDDLPEIDAQCRQIAEDQARAAATAARLGTTGALAAIAAARRGPGQPGSAHRFPGEYPGRAAQFATGMLFDVMPGRPELAGFADAAAGADDRFDGASDDEVLGVLCGWDRVEAHAAARKHAAVAELIRRRPAPGHALEGPARMPPVWDEFTANELGTVLAASRWDADRMLGLAHDLEVKLPGTKAAFLDGIVDQEKAGIIVRAVAVLDPAEARAAEALVLERAGRLTPSGLRSAIVRAVIEVNPDKARKRRETAAREARVERWAEESGNAALAGRELPPAEVLAADQRITWWARQLKLAGLEGGLDELRAQAYMDLLLGTDSRPGQDAASSQEPPGTVSPGTARKAPAGRVRREGEPGDPADHPARPGRTARRDPRPGPHRPRPGPRPRPGRRAEPRDHLVCHRNRRARPCDRPRLRPTPTSRPPRETGETRETRAAGRPRPAPRSRDHSRQARVRVHRHRLARPAPDGYGTWQLSTGAGGRQDLIVTLEPIPAGDCDHRYQARGHDPGVKLRHLSQIRHATCTGPGCRRPATQCDLEHNIPYEAGGRSCLCNGGPKCRRDHRLKQHPRWRVDQLPGGTFRWTTPSGRQCTTEATRYPI